MKTFLFTVLFSLILGILVVIAEIIVVTTILWNYSWLLTDGGLLVIRISFVGVFLIGLCPPYPKHSDIPLKESCEK